MKPEHAIIIVLEKLEWSKLGKSERQFRDALGIAQIQGEKIDKSYLKFWAAKLNLQREINQLFQKITDLKQ
jgi:hypothetical protein